MKGFMNDTLFRTGAVMFLLLVCLFLAGEWLVPHGPFDMAAEPFQLPSGAHLLGTNDSGQDILASLARAGWNSLLFGLVASLTALLLGTLAGVIAAVKGGWVDIILMRTGDTLLMIPSIMLLILVAAVLRTEPITIGIILGLISWPTIARGLRAQVLSLMQKGYVRVSREMGGSLFHVARTHLLPELYPIMVVGFSAKFRMAVFMEATLAFLGLVDPARKSLGMMIRFALKYYYLDSFWNWILPVLLVLSLLIMSVTFIALSVESGLDRNLRFRSWSSEL
jgi:peptide/nickel transport system permease protein